MHVARVRGARVATHPRILAEDGSPSQDRNLAVRHGDAIAK